MTDVPTPAQNLAAAELRAQRARDQLHYTVAQLQSRLDPRARAEKVARDARIAGETAVAIAREKPAVTGGVVAGTALVAGVFLGRHRIARLFARKRPPSPAPANPAPLMRTDP